MFKEHSVITFLKNHGKEIIDKEKAKYETIREKTIENNSFKIDENKNNSPLQMGNIDIELIKLYTDQHIEIDKLKQENIKLLETTNEEWYEKYRKYKKLYKETKAELKSLRLENKQIKKEIDELKKELKKLTKKIKGKEREESTEKETSTEESETEGENRKITRINYIEDIEDEKLNLIRENEQIIKALGKEKEIKAIIEEEPSDIEDEYEEQAIETEVETDDIVNEDTNNYPEEEMVIGRKINKIPEHIPIGQHQEFKEFIGSMSQGINYNGYFLDLDNVYDEQEINRRISDWTLGMYIALMNSNKTNDKAYIYELISKTLIGKIGYWIQSIENLEIEVLSFASDWKHLLGIFEALIRREFLGERWLVSENTVLAERKMEAITNLNNMRCCKISKLPEYTISFSKFYYSARFDTEESLIYQKLYYDHLPSPYNTEISKEYNNIEPKENTLGERIRVLRAYLLRKCEEYRMQQRIKKDKRKGLREICGLTEKKLRFGCEKGEYRQGRKRRKQYKPYKKFRKKNYKPYYKGYKRRRFRKYKNTPENRKRFKKKRKFRRRKRYNRPAEDNKKPYECRCWNCNEKGHYANKCPKLKQRKVRYINTEEFIMSLEYISGNEIHNYEEFYVSETEIEDDNEEFVGYLETESEDSDSSD